MNYSIIRLLIKEFNLLPELIDFINLLYYQSDKVKIALNKNNIAVIINGCYKTMTNIKTIKFRDNVRFTLLNNGDLYKNETLFLTNIKNVYCRDDYVLARNFDDKLFLEISYDGDYLNTYDIIDLKVKYNKIYCQQKFIAIGTEDRKIYLIGSNSHILICEDVDQIIFDESEQRMVVNPKIILDDIPVKINKVIYKKKLALLNDNHFYLIDNYATDKPISVLKYPKLIKTFKYVDKRILVLNIDNSITLLDENLIEI
jgi:hypothetical protein